MKRSSLHLVTETPAPAPDRLPDPYETVSPVVHTLIDSLDGRMRGLKRAYTGRAITPLAKAEALRLARDMARESAALVEMLK